MTLVMEVATVMTISKTRLKARMLEVFRHIEETGEEVIVTDRGRAVLRIEPVQARRSVDAVFGQVRETGVRYGEDPNTPSVGEWPEP